MAANVRSGMRVAAVNSNTVDIVVPLSEKGCGIGCDTTQARRADPTQPIDPRIAQVVPAEEWTARLTECNDALYEDRPDWRKIFIVALPFIVGLPFYFMRPDWRKILLYLWGGALFAATCFQLALRAKVQKKAIAVFDPWQEQYGISTHVNMGGKNSQPRITFTLPAHLAQ